MKKKFISFCTMLCLIFPCFFAVACKEKKDGDKVSAYSYSITLKGAKGKIDESTLPEEYDYSKDKNVSWTESNGDYTISVSRNSVLSGSTIVSLLEGFDYSGLSFTVNDESAEFTIKSGNKDVNGADAYLTDRQFVYKYSKMSKNTSMVLDFSDCKLAKVELDLSDLKSHSVTYYIVEDDFVTIEQAQNGASSNFTNITNEKITVDYGTVVACNSSEQLVIDEYDTEELKNFSYATYGERYFVSSNRVQYLRAQRSGKCEVYSITSDESKNGSVRILATSGLRYATSLNDLTNARYVTTTQEYEYFDGEMLSLSVMSATSVFIELVDDSPNFNYWLVDRLGSEWLDSDKVEIKTMEGSERKYLQLDLVDESGSALASKYLVRKPKNTSLYYAVYAVGVRENTSVINADAVIVGSANRPTNMPSSMNDSVIYYFKNNSEVKVTAPLTIADINSDNGQTIKNVKIFTANIDTDTGSVIRDNKIDDVVVNPNTNSLMSVNCYSSSYSKLYRMTFNYELSAFSDFNFTVSADNIHLYEGETIYYSTTPLVMGSWTKLTSDKVVNLSNSMQSGNTPALYYYMESNREDADLQIQNVLGENISGSNRYLDCFGRVLNGSLEIDGKTIDLSKIKYLEIVAGYYAYNQTATIIRNYDETYHTLASNNVDASNIMISLSGYQNEWYYKPLNTMSDLRIRYTGSVSSVEIYYYVNTDTNNYLVLKDSKGDVVSTCSRVYNQGKAETIQGSYIYSLSLNAGYYEMGEEFKIEEIEGTYNLCDESNDQTWVYTTNDRLGTTYDLRENKSYFLICDDGYRLDIYDQKGNKIVDWSQFIFITNVRYGQDLYLFTLEFSITMNFEPGTMFKVVKTEKI